MKDMIGYRCLCGETKADKFYPSKFYFCIECHNAYTLKISKEKKMNARALLGGKCQRCNFDQFQSSLDIHHLDPSTKDPNFRSMRSWSWKRIVKELANCILLCKNCHNAFHCDEWQISDIDTMTTATNSLFLPNIKQITEREPQKEKHDNCLCGNLKLKRSKICQDCNMKMLRPKFVYPCPEEISSQLKTKSMKKYSKELGISDRALSKHIKKLGIDRVVGSIPTALTI